MAKCIRVVNFNIEKEKLCMHQLFFSISKNKLISFTLSFITDDYISKL